MCAVICALTVGACGDDGGDDGADDGDGDVDRSLRDQLDEQGERSEFVDGLLEGSVGLMTRGEAECVADRLLATDITPEEIDAATRDPFGSTARGIDEFMSACIDPDAPLDVPLDGPVGDRMAQGLAASGMSPEAIQCFFDGLGARGYDARDFVVAGSNPDAVPDFQSALGAIAAECGDA